MAREARTGNRNSNCSVGRTSPPEPRVVHSAGSSTSFNLEVIGGTSRESNPTLRGPDLPLRHQMQIPLVTPLHTEEKVYSLAHHSRPRRAW
jgi:hypothetical protein